MTRPTGQIPIRWRCPGCGRRHFDVLPGTAEDVLSLELRCPDCLSAVPVLDAVEEVRPESRRPPGESRPGESRPES